MNTEQTRDKVIEIVLKHEGGYANDPDDLGKETMYGITIAVAREDGYEGEMKNLPLERAINIYQKKYWNRIKGDQVLEIAGQEVAGRLMDIAVNMGRTRAGRYLQMILNCFGFNLTVDGVIGEGTLKCLKHFKDFKVLYHYLTAKQASRYIKNGQHNSQKKYMLGWGRRLENNYQF